MPFAHNQRISESPIDGGIEITRQQYEDALVGMQSGLEVTITDGFKVALPPEPVAPVMPEPTVEEMIAAKIKVLEAKVQERLDAQARAMNFDSILSGISNASLPLGEYRQVDGAALLLWRARTRKKCTEIRDAFLAGQRPEPTWQEVEAELPGYPII